MFILLETANKSNLHTSCYVNLSAWPPKFPCSVPDSCIYAKLKLVQKGRNAKRGVGVGYTGCEIFFWSWFKKGEMRKGGWVRKGWVQSSFAPGCEKIFSGAARPHPPKKNPEYAPVYYILCKMLQQLDIMVYIHFMNLLCLRLTHMYV